MARRFSEFLIARRRWLLATAMVLVAVACMSAGPLKFDRSLVNMFAPDDPLLRYIKSDQPGK